MTAASEKLKAAEAQWREEQAVRAREKRLAALQQRAEDRAELKRRMAPPSVATQPPPRTPDADSLSCSQIWGWGLRHGAHALGKLLLYLLALSVGVTIAVAVGICGAGKSR